MEQLIPSAGAATVAPVLPATSSPTDIVDAFDPPYVEVVDLGAEPGGRRRTRDVPFARADMDYWATWASQLKEKRRREAMDLLNKMPGIDPMIKLQAMRDIQRDEVHIDTVLRQQYTPAGIRKLLMDGMERGGIASRDERLRLLKRIPPGRQQIIATEICSEPKPTIVNLREAVRALLEKINAGISKAELEAMGDEDLIRIASQYQPVEHDPGAEDGGALIARAGGAGPLSGGAELPEESTGDSAPMSSATSSPEPV